MKEESKLKAYAQADKKEGALRKSIESLLGKTSSPCLFLISLQYFIVVMNHFSAILLGTTDTSLNNHRNNLRQATCWSITIKGFPHGYLLSLASPFLSPSSVQ
jgi:hypothetical protein